MSQGTRVFIVIEESWYDCGLSQDMADSKGMSINYVRASGRRRVSVHLSAGPSEKKAWLCLLVVYEGEGAGETE